MNSDIAIKVNNLSKIYHLYDKPEDRLKEALNPFKKKYHHDFYALNEVSFEIKKGETVGIIGKNGAGKSTLLKIITGVLTPTSGSVEVNGKISSLLELGAGFNPEMTGIENIYLNGTIMGFSEEEMDSKVDVILEFADIGKFVYQQVKTYSSGMFARLAFSVAVNIDPDILIVDEVLSVGDMAFQAKCILRMKLMISNGATVLFVSHDITSIKDLCQSAILLKNARIEMMGNVKNVAERYYSSQFESQKKSLSHSNSIIYSNIKAHEYSNAEFLKNCSYQRIQNGKLEILNVVLLDENEQQIKDIEFGQIVHFRIHVFVKENIDDITSAFHIRNQNAIEIAYDDTFLQNQPTIKIKKNEQVILDWEYTVNLQAGIYNLAVMFSIVKNISIADVEVCDFIPIALQFKVSSSNRYLYASTWANSKLKVLKD